MGIIIMQYAFVVLILRIQFMLSLTVLFLFVFKFWWKAGDFVSSYSERKSGFMKWFSKLLKGGSSRGRGGRHLQQPTEENMVWRNPARALVITSSYFLFCCIYYMIVSLGCLKIQIKIQDKLIRAICYF